MARKILLADDSVTAQNMGRKILADAGYDVVTVNNGSAALKRIAELKPDLIVLDVYMPGYSGLEVCQRLKDSAETAHIPVLLTVGKLEPFKPEEARRVRADAHIVKPFEASELLTVITRLEDRMVPQQTESNGDADTGWKSRLRFPSKKKKEEPAPEDVAAGATFRDFRNGQGQNDASEAFTVKAAPPPGQEPALGPDIPRDITPEELDALSALAAKLDGPIPTAENIAPLAEEMGPGEVPTAEFALDAKKEVEAPAPPAVETFEPAAVAVEAPALAVEAKSEVEIPVEHLEPASEVAVAEQAAEAQTPAPADAAVVSPVAVNIALLVEEPAPVDRDDEPLFASRASAVEQAAAEEKIEVKQAEAPKSEASAQETTEAEDLSPSDAELAEALRLLTPATGHADVSFSQSTIPSHGTLVTAGQLLAEEAGRNAAAGPRWVAESVTLSPEEAAISLEAEMFRTLAAMPAAVSAATSGGEIEPSRITGVSAIAAAVENRLAAAGLAASAEALAEQGAERSSSEHGSRTTSAGTSAVAAPAEVMAAVSNAASPAVDGIEPEKLEAEQKDSPAKVVEEAPAEEVAAATFADAVGKDEVEAPAEQSGEPVSGRTAAVAEENQDLSSDAGGQESMGKGVKAKSGKSNWHQIHTAPASAPANSDVVEAAKRAEHGAEEPPKARAAAAAAEGSASASVPDTSTIASIVDSVLADLRPRIVEEIARKLAGK